MRDLPMLTAVVAKVRAPTSIRAAISADLIETVDAGLLGNALGGTAVAGDLFNTTC